MKPMTTVQVLEQLRQRLSAKREGIVRLEAEIRDLEWLISELEGDGERTEDLRPDDN